MSETKSSLTFRSLLPSNGHLFLKGWQFFVGWEKTWSSKLQRNRVAQTEERCRAWDKADGISTSQFYLNLTLPTVLIKWYLFLPRLYCAFVRSKPTTDLGNNGLFFPLEFRVFSRESKEGKVYLLWLLESSVSFHSKEKFYDSSKVKSLGPCWGPAQ